MIRDLSRFDRQEDWNERLRKADKCTRFSSLVGAPAVCVWDRSPLNGYQVIFIPFFGGMPSGKPIPVVTGFLGEGNRIVRGRPVGVALDRTGSLLVADDVANTVWRVSAAPANLSRASKGQP
jgi:hypothetical protein